jgi:hypothetical protein
LGWEAVWLGAAAKAMRRIAEPSRQRQTASQPNPEGRALFAAGYVCRFARCAASRCTAILACGENRPGAAHIEV